MDRSGDGVDRLVLQNSTRPDYLLLAELCNSTERAPKENADRLGKCPGCRKEISAGDAAAG